MLLLKTLVVGVLFKAVIQLPKVAQGKDIDMGRNNITILTEGMLFKDVTNLTSLDLNNHKISTISSKAFSVDMSQLKDIPIFWLKKSVTKVMVNDFNKNGIWDVDDCRITAEKIISIGNIKGAQAKEVYKFYSENAPMYFHTATNLTEWLIADLNFRDDPNTRQLIHDYLETWFRVLDLDGDGVIDQHEFKVFWDAYGLDPNYMKHQFDYIDKDKDGLISCQELVKVYFDYFYNTEENANIFWGPLKDIIMI
ncbi:unnamed protein product [Owenia fusiformis]|uniref:EF-hand domain-containing protein n=1 Tax=Owenia fusiformis TaxID=6347 RepID=A0A8S4N8U5_OWEFU|nr:unnamed protein product [Owenia fusiformis]